MKKCNIHKRSNDFNSLLAKITKGNEVVNLHSPVFFGNEKKYLNECVDSTYVSSKGRFIELFENKVSKLSDTKYNVAMVNGTSALHLALIITGVKPGDEVITQALSFVATSNAIVYCNASPIYIDVDISTMGMSPEHLNNFLNEYGELKENGTYNKLTGKKISACLPMHTFGFMCRIDEIAKICKKWKISLIEDSAEAFSSSYKNVSAGSTGKISTFSFNGNKIITSGGGGSLTSNSKSIYIRAKHLASTAKVSKNWEFIHNESGFNYRMPNLNAALGLAQLENFDRIKENKKKLYNFYKDNLKEIGLNLKEIPKNNDWNYWLMSISFENKKERDLFLRHTNSKGLLTRPIWKLLYKLPMFNNYQRDSQRNAEFLEKTIVNIPSNVQL